MYRVFVVRKSPLPKEKNRTTKDVKVMGVGVISNFLLVFPLSFLVCIYGREHWKSPLLFHSLSFRQVSGCCLLGGREGLGDWLEYYHGIT